MNTFKEKIKDVCQGEPVTHEVPFFIPSNTSNTHNESLTTCIDLVETDMHDEFENVCLDVDSRENQTSFHNTSQVSSSPPNAADIRQALIECHAPLEVITYIVKAVHTYEFLLKEVCGAVEHLSKENSPSFQKADTLTDFTDVSPAHPLNLTLQVNPISTCNSSRDPTVPRRVMGLLDDQIINKSHTENAPNNFSKLPVRKDMLQFGLNPSEAIREIEMQMQDLQDYLSATSLYHAQKLASCCQQNLVVLSQIIEDMPHNVASISPRSQLLAQQEFFVKDPYKTHPIQPLRYVTDSKVVHSLKPNTSLEHHSPLHQDANISAVSSQNIITGYRNSSRLLHQQESRIAQFFYQPEIGSSVVNVKSTIEQPRNVIHPSLHMRTVDHSKRRRRALHWFSPNFFCCCGDV